MRPKSQNLSDLPSRPHPGWFRNALNVLTRRPWLSATLALLVIASAAWWFASNLNVVAVVDGHKITKSQVDELAPRLQKFYEYNEDEEALKDVKGSTLDYLVEDKIIHVEAAKRGLSADSAEIERRYRQVVGNYSSEAEYVRIIDSIYGWTPELNKQAIERQLLRDQLDPLVVGYRTGKFIAVQYVPGGRVPVSAAAYEQRSKNVAERIKADIDKEGFDSIYKKAASYGDLEAESPLHVSASSNRWVSNEPEVDKEILDTVFSTAEGSVSGIVKTGTFYGIFKVENISSGTASSWDDFIQTYPKQVHKERLQQTWYQTLWGGMAARLQPNQVLAVAGDKDNDGIKDGKDNCPNNKNASQKDTDGDGKGDACDSDDDNDGIPDSSDDCPTSKETKNGYKDGDGCPDTPPAPTDTDNDGVADNKDNCPNDKNAGQADNDGDGKGNACDTDDDNDGLADSKDPCPYDKDCDNDGIIDGADNCPEVKEDKNGYKDGDGCPDESCDSDNPNARCHGTRVHGTVIDAITGETLNDVSVTAFVSVIGDQPSCLDQPNNPKCNCGRPSHSMTTGGGGYYSFNRQDGTYCRVNCFWTSWKISFAKEGYASKTYWLGSGGDLENGDKDVIHAQLAPKVATVNVVAKRSDNGNEIDVPITVLEGGSGSPRTSFSLDKKATDTKSEFTWLFEAPSQAEGNGGAPLEYDSSKGTNGWSGCDAGNQAIRRCQETVIAGNTATVTVWYRPRGGVTCSTQQSSYSQGTIVTFKAEGTPDGNTYTWSAFGSGASAPVYGNGSGYQNASVTYSTPGTKTATVNYGGETASCTVTITAPSNLTCSPSSTSANVNQSRTFTAGNGSGTHTWIVATGSPSSTSQVGPSDSFTVSFGSTGTHLIMVSTPTNGVATCQVTVTSTPTGGGDASLTVASVPITGVTPINSSGGCFNSVPASNCAGNTGVTNWTMTRSGATLTTTLTAPGTYGGYTFSNWSGCDSQSSPTTCTVTVAAGSSKTVLVYYYIPPPPPGSSGTTPGSEIDFDQGERPPVY